MIKLLKEFLNSRSHNHKYLKILWLNNNLVLIYRIHQEPSHNYQSVKINYVLMFHLSPIQLFSFDPIIKIPVSYNKRRFWTIYFWMILILLFRILFEIFKTRTQSRQKWSFFLWLRVNDLIVLHLYIYIIIMLSIYKITQLSSKCMSTYWFLYINLIITYNFHLYFPIKRYSLRRYCINLFWR